MLVVYSLRNTKYSAVIPQTAPELQAAVYRYIHVCICVYTHVDMSTHIHTRYLELLRKRSVAASLPLPPPAFSR